ncbi:MAG: SDR family NAD(P)-dependent oxidoreductase [Cohaesibacteraceae bacterium]
MEFEGKTAIVTGAAMGIGKACADTLVAQGAKVVLADIDADAGQQAADALGDAARFIKTDVRSMDDMRAMAALAVQAFGGIDILVNNAALALGGIVDEIDEEDWQTVIDTNLSSVWRGMRVCVPEMRRRGGGAVVNMSSVQGLIGFKGWPAYAAAKGGINALTKQSAVDLAPHGIRVNAVAPGTIMTPLNQKLFDDMDDPSELIETWNKAHPIGRFGEAQEVADLVAYLASDKASFITGEIIRVDGGLAVRGE